MLKFKVSYYRSRSNGNGSFSYYPFEILEPHQVYWFVRVRPDHRTIEKGGSSLFSLEVRCPDMPTNIQRIQMINSLVVGLAYYIADHGSQIDVPFTSDFRYLKSASVCGLDTQVDGTDMRKVVETLVSYAVRGLEERGYQIEGEKLGSEIHVVLRDGNDADLIRRYKPRDVEGLKGYLVGRLKGE